MLASSKWPIRPIGEMMPVGTSPAARFQAVQTRARMGAALWCRALRFILFVWLVLTIWVIWYRVGLYRPELHHEYSGAGFSAESSTTRPSSTASQRDCQCTRTTVGTPYRASPNGSTGPKCTATPSIPGTGTWRPAWEVIIDLAPTCCRSDSVLCSSHGDSDATLTTRITFAACGYSHPVSTSANSMADG